MKIVKSLATMPIVLALVACATVSGKTRASARVQSDVMDVIQVLETASGPSCDERKLTKTEVVKRATADDYSAVERWTIDRCGKLIGYLVTFKRGANGGVDFSVRPER
jgi:hypothetical protein